MEFKKIIGYLNIVNAARGVVNLDTIDTRAMGSMMLGTARVSRSVPDDD